MRREIVQHFRRHDPVLAVYIDRMDEIGDLEQSRPETYFYRLCREIIFQQLSNKAGNAILKRFEDLFPEHKINPALLMRISHEQIRSAGLSNAKARYIKNIAEAVLTNSVNFAELALLPNDAVIAELTKIKGVGTWTAEMFMIFVLGRENVFSFGDLGLKKGFKKVYNLKDYPSETHIRRALKAWSPYESYASLILWGSLEVSEAA